MTILPYSVIDAFVAGPFSGNPAGVCVLEEWLPAETMQSIATQNNLSETAFLVAQAPAEYAIRWFTPAREVDLCGHATLASSFVLFQKPINIDCSTLKFTTIKGQKLSVTKEGELLALDFPSTPGVLISTPEQIKEALMCDVAECVKGDDLLVRLHTEEDVRMAQPNQEILSRIDTRGILITAPGKDCDYVTRAFFPRLNVPEDPVCGSANCMLIPYWAAQTGKSDFFIKQLSARGGELYGELNGTRVTIKGRAREYLQGTITF